MTGQRVDYGITVNLGHFSFAFRDPLSRDLVSRFDGVDSLYRSRAVAGIQCQIVIYQHFASRKPLLL